MNRLRDLFMFFVCLAILLWMATFGNTQHFRDAMNELDGED